MIGIYKITSPTGKVYIGQSTNIEIRWEKYLFLNCKNQPRLYSSLKKHGAKNHIFEVIEECSFENLNTKERFWQDQFDVLGENGLNCILQSTTEKRVVVSKETRKKLSIISSGINNSFFNKKHSEQTKINWSKKRKGRDSVRAKLILDTQTGIFYFGFREAAEAYDINPSTLKAYIYNRAPNKTNLIQI